MKHLKNWQRVVTNTLLLTLGIPVFLSSTATANTRNLSNYQPAQTAVSESQSERQITQNLNTCYEVIVEHGLIIQKEPTVYSQALGGLYFGQKVAIAPGRTAYWMPIVAPMQGYVWANWIAPCRL